MGVLSTNDSPMWFSPPTDSSGTSQWGFSTFPPTPLGWTSRFPLFFSVFCEGLPIVTSSGLLTFGWCGGSLFRAAWGFFFGRS